MKKSIILVCVLAVALVGILYSLPKIVVNSKTQEVDKNTESSHYEGDGHDHGENEAHQEPSNSHGSKSLTATQLQEIQALKVKLGQGSGKEQASTAINIAEKFRLYQQFDSAAYYAEKAAQLVPSAELFLRAGDLYYEAFGFAIDEEKAKTLGEKTRVYYQKALDENPNLLAAKANLAMTYVNSPNPMQGIMLLREILENDPTNELALFNLGILSMRSNQFAKAVDRFQQIVRNNPSNTKASFYLGVSLLETGRKEDARKVLAEVKKQEKDPAIQQAIVELEARLNE
jgi:tetratricopeptide (TPR) repeat protein